MSIYNKIFELYGLNTSGKIDENISLEELNNNILIYLCCIRAKNNFRLPSSSSTSNVRTISLDIANKIYDRYKEDLEYRYVIPKDILHCLKNTPCIIETDDLLQNIQYNTNTFFLPLNRLDSSYEIETLREYIDSTENKSIVDRYLEDKKKNIKFINIQYISTRSEESLTKSNIYSLSTKDDNKVRDLNRGNGTTITSQRDSLIQDGKDNNADIELSIINNSLQRLSQSIKPIKRGNELQSSYQVVKLTKEEMNTDDERIEYMKSLDGFDLKNNIEMNDRRMLRNALKRSKFAGTDIYKYVENSKRQRLLHLSKSEETTEYLNRNVNIQDVIESTTNTQDTPLEILNNNTENVLSNTTIEEQDRMIINRGEEPQQDIPDQISINTNSNIEPDIDENKDDNTREEVDTEIEDEQGDEDENTDDENKEDTSEDTTIINKDTNETNNSQEDENNNETDTNQEIAEDINNIQDENDNNNRNSIPNTNEQGDNSEEMFDNSDIVNMNDLNHSNNNFYENGDDKTTDMRDELIHVDTDNYRRPNNLSISIINHNNEQENLSQEQFYDYQSHLLKNQRLDEAINLYNYQSQLYAYQISNIKPSPQYTNDDYESNYNDVNTTIRNADYISIYLSLIDDINNMSSISSNIQFIDDIKDESVRKAIEVLRNLQGDDKKTQLKEYIKNEIMKYKDVPINNRAEEMNDSTYDALSLIDNYLSNVDGNIDNILNMSQEDFLRQIEEGLMAVLNNYKKKIASAFLRSKQNDRYLDIDEDTIDTSIINNVIEYMKKPELYTEMTRYVDLSIIRYGKIPDNLERYVNKEDITKSFNTGRARMLFHTALKGCSVDDVPSIYKEYVKKNHSTVAKYYNNYNVALQENDQLGMIKYSNSLKKYGLSESIDLMVQLFKPYDDMDNDKCDGLFNMKDRIPSYKKDPERFLKDNFMKTELQNEVFKYKLYSSELFKKYYNLYKKNINIDNTLISSALPLLSKYLIDYTDAVDMNDRFDPEVKRLALLKNANNKVMDNMVTIANNNILDIIYKAVEKSNPVISLVDTYTNTLKPNPTQKLYKENAMIDYNDFKIDSYDNVSIMENMPMSDTNINLENDDMKNILINYSTNNTSPNDFISGLLDRATNSLTDIPTNNDKISSGEDKPSSEMNKEYTVEIIKRLLSPIKLGVYRAKDIANFIKQLITKMQDDQVMTYHTGSNITNILSMSDTRSTIETILRYYKSEDYLFGSTINNDDSDVLFYENIIKALKLSVYYTNIDITFRRYLEEELKHNLRTRKVAPEVVYKLNTQQLYKISESNPEDSKQTISIFVSICLDTYNEISDDYKQHIPDGDSEAVVTDLGIEEIDDESQLPSMNSDNTYIHMLTTIIEYYKGKMSTILNKFNASINTNNMLDVFNGVLPFSSPFTRKLDKQKLSDKKYIAIYTIHILAFLIVFKDSIKISKERNVIDSTNTMISPYENGEYSTISEDLRSKKILYTLSWYYIYTYMRSIFMVNTEYGIFSDTDTNEYGMKDKFNIENNTFMRDIINRMDESVISFSKSMTNILSLYVQHKDSIRLTSIGSIMKSIKQFSSKLSDTGLDIHISDIYTSDSLRLSIQEVLQSVVTKLMNISIEKYTSIVSPELMEERFGSNIPDNLSNIDIFSLMLPVEERFKKTFDYNNETKLFTRQFINNSDVNNTSYSINDFSFNARKIDDSTILDICKKYIAKAKIDHLKFNEKRDKQLNISLLQFINELVGEIFKHTVYDNNYFKIMQRLLTLREYFNRASLMKVSVMIAYIEQLKIKTRQDFDYKYGTIYINILSTIIDICSIFDNIVQSVRTDIDAWVDEINRDIPKLSHIVKEVYNKVKDNNDIERIETLEDFKTKVYTELVQSEREKKREMEKAINDYQNKPTSEDTVEKLYIEQLSFNSGNYNSSGGIVTEAEKKIFIENAISLQKPEPIFKETSFGIPAPEERFRILPYFRERDIQFHDKITAPFRQDGPNLDQSPSDLPGSISKRIMDDNLNQGRSRSYFYEPYDTNERIMSYFSKQIR